MTKYTTISIDQGTLKRLHYLKAKLGVSVSEIIRGMVRNKYREEFPRGYDEFAEEDEEQGEAVPIVG